MNMVTQAERPPLTKKQRAIYEFIRGYIARHGFPPVIREIGEEMGISSPNGVICHLKALKAKGYINRDDRPEHRGRSRTMTLTDADPAARDYDISVEFKGAVVAVSGRGRFSRAEWVAWLKGQLERAGEKVGGL
jgi:SOS-response transcriptional repressor LexA